MRVSSIYMPPSGPHPGQPHAGNGQTPAQAFSFFPFEAQAFSMARARRVPVFLLIGDVTPAFSDPSLQAQLAERTVPVRLTPGERPDVELLCQRAGALFSGEGALPLCALLLPDGLPFLAAPLPPAGFPLDPSRLFVWLSQADRRYIQNAPAMSAQAASVVRSFSAPALRRDYSPKDAAHDLFRALSAAHDPINGGFGQVKQPMVCALRFMQHEAGRGEKVAHAILSKSLDAMIASSLHDPLDGSFFRATLTPDWRVFIPEKVLGLNALLAPILLRAGRRSEAIRLLDFIIDAFSIGSGGLCASLTGERSMYAFTSHQVCAALGSEDGLRACRLLSLLRQKSTPEPSVLPSRFSPIPSDQPGSALNEEPPALCPTLSEGLTPEDAAFLRRAAPQLLRARIARNQPRKSPVVLTESCALAASVLAGCGKQLGESRYIQAAQRAVSYLIAQPNAPGGTYPLPPSLLPARSLNAHATCAASASLSLALLTLGSRDGMEEYAQSGLRLLSCALHAFVRPDGLVMHTQKDPASPFPRVPAIYDSELPSPAAVLVRALRIADSLNPQAHYGEAIETIWAAAAPAAHAQPIACASLIDAVSE